MKYYSARKKEWNKAICSKMDVIRCYHTEGIKSDTEIQILYHDIDYHGI